MNVFLRLKVKDFLLMLIYNITSLKHYIPVLPDFAKWFRRKWEASFTPELGFKEGIEYPIEEGIEYPIESIPLIFACFPLFFKTLEHPD